MRLVTFTALVSIVAASTAAQPTSMSADPAISQLIGRWEGSGTILGQPSRVELEWASALGDRFARLTWVSHIGAAPKSQRFEGHAYYAPAAGGGYRATWFDSSGMTRPIAATWDGTALVAHWGTRETEQGETTYRLTSPDAIEVVDRVLGKSGEWREFGRSTLTRVR